MRVLLGSGLAVILALVGLSLAFDWSALTSAESVPSAAADGAATPRRNAALTYFRDQRQVRSFEALAALITLNAEPRKRWHPDE
jgi:hypothetical protein